ncbi:restriction endonuclease subunit S [Staphylococcus hominis]|uniref:restriction endonuclease subunit S n=1 Tax=Staphylococcus hominis TaxID=1290 RepID=UPI001F561EA4|nr:restriction endonuclease subunit S [Staphylococcus hominis]MCI2901865.1 restriction endonuclease subunit S [Staphylococcus hominis]
MTKQTNTPELRFPEFKNEWSKLTMNDFLIEDKQYGTQKDTNFPIVTSSRQGLYIQNKYFEGDRSFANENVTFSIVPINYFTYRHMSDDDIFKFNINKFNTPILVSKEYPVFTVKNTFSQNFIFYELNNNIRFLKFCRIQKKGGTRTRLYFKNLLKYQTYFPNYEEQQKIGAFFYLLDQQIELEEKKLELLEQQKRGYMQKIFSQELRFKDENNNNYPEWKIKKLEEISEFQNGKAHENFVSDTGNFILVNSKFISTESKVKKYVDKQLTPLGINDIAIVMSDVPNGKALAKCYLIENDNTFTLNQRIGRIFNIEGNSRFLFTQINRNKQLLKYDSGVGQTNLKKSEIIGIKIYWPNKREQDKIGDFFINLDSIIEKQSTKVELLKQRKKGLLQKMFV